MITVNLETNTVEGFSAHSDINQLKDFVGNSSPKPNRVLCVHGEESRCIDLCRSLHKKYNMRTQAPKNLETIRFH